jgi:hypothetical protein
MNGLLESLTEVDNRIRLSFRDYNILQAQKIKSDDQRRGAALRFEKDPKDVTAVELMDYWITGGGLADFNAKYCRIDLMCA